MARSPSCAASDLDAAGRARCTPSWAPTAPAKAPSATCSPAMRATTVTAGDRRPSTAPRPARHGARRARAAAGHLPRLSGPTSSCPASTTPTSFAPPSTPSAAPAASPSWTPRAPSSASPAAESKRLHFPDDMLKRNVNVGFSGGEKKRNEVLQMALLRPKLAILDETDSGLDIDALRIVADGVNAQRRRRLLRPRHHPPPAPARPPGARTVSTCSAHGRIIRSGGPELARELEANGYSGRGGGAPHEPAQVTMPLGRGSLPRALSKVCATACPGDVSDARDARRRSLQAATGLPGTKCARRPGATPALRPSGRYRPHSRSPSPRSPNRARGRADLPRPTPARPDRRPLPAGPLYPAPRRHRFGTFAATPGCSAARPTRKLPMVAPQHHARRGRPAACTSPPGSTPEPSSCSSIGTRPPRRIAPSTSTPATAFHLEPGARLSHRSKSGGRGGDLFPQRRHLGHRRRPRTRLPRPCSPTAGGSRGLPHADTSFVAIAESRHVRRLRADPRQSRLARTEIHARLTGPNAPPSTSTAPSSSPATSTATSPPSYPTTPPAAPPARPSRTCSTDRAARGFPGQASRSPAPRRRPTATR